MFNVDGIADPFAGSICTRSCSYYQTLNADGTCSPTGSGGASNASSGNSNGWQQWSINLKPYAGKSVEISIAYVSD